MNRFLYVVADKICQHKLWLGTGLRNPFSSEEVCPGEEFQMGEF